LAASREARHAGFIPGRGTALMPWSDTTGARIDPPGRHLRRQKAKSAGDRRAPTRQTGWLTALKALFQQVENPSAYNAPKFAEAMRSLGIRI